MRCPSLRRSCRASTSCRDSTSGPAADSAVAQRADFGDPVLAALAARDPVNSAELGAAVRAYIALGLDEQAVELIAAYLNPRNRSQPGPNEDVAAEEMHACAYCVSQLERTATAYPARPDAELETVLAALDILERDAREKRDGDLLVSLAAVFAELDVLTNNGLSLSFQRASTAG